MLIQFIKTEGLWRNMLIYLITVYLFFIYTKSFRFWRMKYKWCVISEAQYNPWGCVSKAFSKFKIKVFTCLSLTKILAQSFITMINWVSQLCLFRNVCCLSDKSLSSSKCAIMLEQTKCSSNLHGTHVKENNRLNASQRLISFFWLL